MRPVSCVCLRDMPFVMLRAGRGKALSVRKGELIFLKKIIEGACRLKFVARWKNHWQGIFYVDRFSKKIKSAIAKLLCLVPIVIGIVSFSSKEKEKGYFAHAKQKSHIKKLSA